MAAGGVMPVSTGALRHRVTLQRPIVGANDAYGQPAVTYHDEGAVWAEVAPISGREFWQAQQVQSDVTHRVTIRARDGLGAAVARAPVQSTWRLAWRGKTLEVESVLPDPTGRQFQQLLCKEIVVPGYFLDLAGGGLLDLAGGGALELAG